MAAGTIDNPLISIFIQGKNSSIKFGGFYNTQAIMKDTASFFHT